MKENINYEFHHTGIPTSDVRDGEIYSPNAGMYTSDNDGKFRIQWHRFTQESPLHPLIKALPHVAFKVSDLQEAIAGEEVILGPYEPIDDYFVAIINDGGVPVELIQTSLSDEEIWDEPNEERVRCIGLTIQSSRRSRAGAADLKRQADIQSSVRGS